MEALKKVAVRIVKLLITDSFEEGSEVLIDAQWLGRIREEIEEVKRNNFRFNFFSNFFFFLDYQIRNSTCQNYHPCITRKKVRILPSEIHLGNQF